ncbi:hypothetical protein ACE1B6_09410 [Aerosakkonemataceae cyanobacterium BLCC-F154]|uniref:Uncharacterized protein n=1 Tax=Floridaenema fluviatile BLCC-F154 TaxID=3153640 RepID=A0ABV4Y9J2_9CYAN
MRQLSFIALFGTLAILVGGCGGGETETATSPTPIAPAATTPATEPTPQQSPTQPFSSPMVEPKQPAKPTPGAAAPKPAPNVIVTAPPELTPPTDPNQRTAEVQKEIDKANRDPFGLPPFELNPQQPNQNVNRTPTQTQTPNRTIPNVEGVPEARPPVVSLPSIPTTTPTTTATAPTQRNVPTVTGVPSAQAPVVRIPRRTPPRIGRGSTTAPGRAIPQAPVASVPTAPGITRRTAQPRRVSPRPTTRQTQPTQVARAPQRTQKPATRTAQNATRTAQKPQRTQTPNRTVAAAPKPAPAPTPAIVAPPAPPEIPTLPPPPDPILAKAVEVSGVVIVGSQPQAIVKAPNETTSRYVRAGQRLSNGQVLVKRIEVNEGSEPIVILEQNGVEVAKIVGERPVTTQPGTQAVTPIPVTGKSQDNV